MPPVEELQAGVIVETVVDGETKPWLRLTRALLDVEASVPPKGTGTISAYEVVQELPGVVTAPVNSGSVEQAKETVEFSEVAQEPLALVTEPTRAGS